MVLNDLCTRYRDTTQIWIALITYLMLAFLRFKSGLGLSFQQLLRLLQINLFDRRNLVDLCHPQ
jgi:predicted Na+-dependent transporter